jgi:hypothetical protein
VNVELNLHTSTSSLRVTASLTDTVLLEQRRADDVVAVTVRGMCPRFVGMMVNLTDCPASPHTQSLLI